MPTLENYFMTNQYHSINENVVFKINSLPYLRQIIGVVWFSVFRSTVLEECETSIKSGGITMKGGGADRS